MDRAANEWACFFNGHAPFYNDNCFTSNTVIEVGFLLEELGLQPGQSILDVGCGTGRHSIELARRGYQVTGVDISPGMLAIARADAQAAGVDLDLVNACATEFTTDRRYDAAICLCEGAFGLLGASDDPVLQPLAILSRVSAVLKPGAPCLFTVLNGYRLARRSAVAPSACRFEPNDLSETSECQASGAAERLRERGFVPTELRLLFAAAGLAVTSIWGGTAGNWKRAPIDLDEFEIMVVACRPHERVVGIEPLLQAFVG